MRFRWTCYLLLCMGILAACGGEDKPAEKEATSAPIVASETPSALESASASTTPDSSVIWVVKADAAVDLLACPAIECEVVGSVEPETELTVLHTDLGYHELRLENGQSAYIDMRFTIPVAVVVDGGVEILDNPFGQNDLTPLADTSDLPPGAATLDPRPTRSAFTPPPLPSQSTTTSSDAPPITGSPNADVPAYPPGLVTATAGTFIPPEIAPTIPQ